MLALLAIGLGSVHPLDGQRILLSAALPCTRLLNATGRVGCATRSSASIAPLYVVTEYPALSALLDDPPDGELVLGLAAALFELATLGTIRRRLGAALHGILVLHAAVAPPGITSPLPASPWLDAGSGLSLERFPFGIVLLTAAESEAVLAHATSFDAASSLDPSAAPLVELRYPMHARDNAPRCLAADGCLPLGGQSVWGSLAPLTADSASAPTRPLVPASKPVIALATQLDATAFFHDQAPGAYAAAASTIALLAAVDSIASSATLRAQLPSLTATPLFFFFTGEMWDAIGSRRLLTDVRHFTCDRQAPSPPPPPPPTPGARPPLPPADACLAPFKPDTTFTQLRDAGIEALVHLGPMGAADGDPGLYVHAEASSASASPSSAADALRQAAAPGMPVRDAAGGHGLPPGPGRAFADAKLALGRRGLAAAGGATEVVTLSDFDRSYRIGGRYGSRFDTLAGLDASRVCAAAGVVARAWWAMLGGAGAPAVNCSVVSELLGCLLPPASNQTRFAAAKEAVEEADTTFTDTPLDVEAQAAQAAYDAACPLAAELGFDRTSLATRYTGVWIEGRVTDPTTLFVKAWLDARLNATCPPVADVENPAPCQPAVLYHDAFPAGIEQSGRDGAWQVRDDTEPLWAESNWPNEMYARLYPHGAPRWEESVMLLGVGAFGALATSATVVLSRLSYKRAYKRL